MAFRLNRHRDGTDSTGGKIAMLMRDRGVTIGDVASAAGLSVQDILAAVSGRPITSKQLDGIAKALGVHPGTLLGNAE